MSSTARVAPSLLAADFARLAEDIRRVEEAGADLLHLDVMDGHFVPNISLGPVVVSSLRRHSAKPFDVHLMISPADPYIPDFVEAGADIVTVHPESGAHLHRSVQLIKSLGKRAGVALNPGTPAEAVDYVLEAVDLVLVMSVNPGFGGQVFIPAMLDKIAALRGKIDATGRTIDLEVDGGVNRDTAPAITAAGADVLVAGSAVFGGDASAYADNISKLRG